MRSPLAFDGAQDYVTCPLGTAKLYNSGEFRSGHSDPQGFAASLLGGERWATCSRSHGTRICGTKTFGNPLRAGDLLCHNKYVARNTEEDEMTGIMAARINRNDTVEIEGQLKTIEDYETLGTVIRWTFTDGTTYTVTPTRYVTALR